MKPPEPEYEQDGPPLVEPRARSGEPEGPGFRSGRVLDIAGAHFIHDVFSSFLPPLLPLLIAKFSLSLTAGGALTLFLRGPMISAPWLGALADRRDLRWFVILGPGFTAVTMTLMGLAPAYSLLALLLLVAGVSVAAFHTPAPVMIVRASGERLGKGLSWYQLGGEMARTIGPLAAVGAVSLWGLEGLWRLMPVGVGSSVLLWWRLRSLPRQDTSLAKSLPFAETWRDIRAVIRPIIAVVLIRALLLSALSGFLPVYVIQRGGSLWLAGGSYSLFQLAGAAGVLSIGTLSDRLGRRRTLLIAAAVSPLLLFLFLMVDGWLQVPVLILLGFFSLSTMPVMIALIQQQRPAHPSTANGLFTATSFALRSLMILVVGALGDWLGLSGAFWISGVLALLALPVLFLLPKDDGRSVRGGSD